MCRRKRSRWSSSALAKWDGLYEAILLAISWSKRRIHPDYPSGGCFTVGGDEACSQQANFADSQQVWFFLLKNQSYHYSVHLKNCNGGSFAVPQLFSESSCNSRGLATCSWNIRRIDPDDPNGGCFTVGAIEVRTSDSSSSPNWLKQLKAVVNDFDDMLYRLEADKHKEDIASENHIMANWLCTKPKSVLSRTKMVQEIKEIKKRFVKIVKQRTEFNAISSSTLVTHHVRPTHKTTGDMSILSNTTDVIGRDEVKYSIISMVVEADIQESISIVSIVGLGGSGKTTLAKYICQDGKIREHFEVVIWVMCLKNLTWKLFQQSSGWAEEDLDSEFIEVGKEIVKKCAGMPIAIKSLAASCSGKIDSKLFSKLRALFVSRGSFATDKPIKKGYCVRSIILEDQWETSVPLFVSKFEYLGYLRISNSRCQELPEAIMGCWNLQAIHVIECFRFATLPESIGKLRKLRTLELSETMDLKSLPQSIGYCHNLESLHLDRCLSLNSVPDSLCKNKKLRLLNIFDCYGLQHLPSETFRLLRNLETINLSKCASLEVLPDSFASEQLHTLKLTGLNNLTVLPQSITSLSNLEHLDLQSCSGLVELPEGIVNSKRLIVLNLQGCSGLRGLPAGFGQLTRLETLGLFVVGESSEHARISELGSLDRLSGKLKLTIDKNPDDAEKAYLKRKNNIHELDLSFRNMDTEVEQETGMEREMAVLNALEPPHGIKVMDIWNYKGLHLPRWLTKKTIWSNKLEQAVDLPHFSLLTRMSLGSLPNVMHLTGLLDLPLLQSLGLSDFDNLESVNIGPFPSLTSLSIEYMPGSLEWTTATRAILGGTTVSHNEATQCCFPSLSDLYISDCPKMNLNPSFPTSIKRLTLNNSIVWPVHPQADNLESLSCRNSNWVSSCSSFVNEPEIGIPSCTSNWEFLQHLCALKFLKITGCGDKLTQLPESMRSLATIKQLSIHQCHGLHLLPECLGELCSLQKIEITDCENLSGLPEVGLGGLRSLMLSTLPRLSRLPESIRGYTSLQQLNISGCDALQQLPEGLGELPSLRRLSIGKLHVLTSLPEYLQGLTSLRSLSIYNCEALHRLPDKLGELCFLTELHIEKLPALTCLPESMQSLTSLHSLSIIDCDALTSLPESIQLLSALMTGHPHLIRRYKRGAENDWHLISRACHRSGR
ncbi:hypothetical protein QYE76_071690 [Lolium multiflorum]|uniref:Uncharacterized protein n=1 Tax=Lolium multiflorum TaxID=4521 RepID=A0AAD8WFM7_LOLMU|nr:hypothetical protein QYE76_071690 [Lolium multiflorum]